MKLSFVLLAALILVGCSIPPNAKSVKTKDGSYTYYQAGITKPTVIFESGLGDNMNPWFPFVKEVESFAEVFAYNRAGFVGSESNNEQRNGAVIVKELRTLLRASNIEPPYVLVGHSLGGAYMELYARTYPDEVAGVVLIDPNSNKYPKRCKQAKLDFCDPPSSIPWWASLFLPPAVEGEIKGFNDTHRQLNAAGEFPDIPLVVLSSTMETSEQTADQKRARALYVQLHKELAESVTRSKFIPCDTCGHYIHSEQPSLVVDAVKWVLKQ